MTVFPLFDRIAAVAERDPGDSRRQERRRQLMAVASSMVALAVQNFQKIRALDEEMASPSDATDAFDMDSALAIRLMYEDAVEDAERILSRIDPLERKYKCVVADAEELRDWHGKTMAMLSVSLAQIARGIEQAERGEVVSAAEMRNELHRRLHH